MNYHNFNSIEDLVFNKSFKNWVLYKTGQDVFFWEKFIADNPGKMQLINDAKVIIYALQIKFETLSEEDINKEIKKVISKTGTQPYYNVISNPITTSPTRYFKFRTYRAVAIFLISILSAGVFYFFSSKSSRRLFSAKQSYFYPEGDNSITVNNTADTNVILLLADGSRVSISPKSQVSYAKDFDINDRKVFLKGEAFFEIEKNIAKPFFVFTNTIVTKVLGTSFSVKAYPLDKQASVLVKSGKVSVIKVNQYDAQYDKATELGGMLITPNQVITYKDADNDFSKAVVDNPICIHNPADGVLEFDATPLSQVFTVLEDAYGIPILYDEEAISSCSLSASLGNEPFFQKLNIICKAINAEYQMVDGSIVINSSGCK